VSDISKEQILDVIEKAKVVNNIHELDASVLFSEQDIDSLDVSGMLLSIEEAFGVEIPDEDIDGLLTINDILGYVNNKIK